MRCIYRITPTTHSRAHAALTPGASIGYGPTRSARVSGIDRTQASLRAREELLILQTDFVDQLGIYDDALP